jgi:hypothetical protein
LHVEAEGVLRFASKVTEKKVKNKRTKSIIPIIVFIVASSIFF